MQRSANFGATKQLIVLDHVISKNTVTPNPAKTAAIKEMEAPTNITELRRFMGIVNQLGKFSPHLAELSNPLRKLISTKQAWLWDTRQEKTFTNVKIDLPNPTDTTHKHKLRYLQTLLHTESCFVTTRRIMATSSLCLKSTNQH